MKPLKASEVPPGVVTVTVRTLDMAPGAMVIVMGKVVAVPPASMTAVTPAPLKLTAVAPVKFVPVTVAGKEEP